MNKIFKKKELDVEQEFTRNKLDLACRQLQVFEPLIRRKFTLFSSLLDTAYTNFDSVLIFDATTNRSFYTDRGVAKFMREILEQHDDNMQSIKLIDTLMDQAVGKMQCFTYLIRGKLMPRTVKYCQSSLKIFLKNAERICTIFEETIENLSFFSREMERLEVQTPFH